MRRAWSLLPALFIGDAEAAEPAPAAVITLRLAESADAQATLNAAVALPGVRALAVGAVPGGGGLIDLSASPARWAELAALPGVVHLGEPWRPSAKAVESEGRATLDLTAWDAAGLTGRGSPSPSSTSASPAGIVPRRAPAEPGEPRPWRGRRRLARRRCRGGDPRRGPRGGAAPVPRHQRRGVHRGAHPGRGKTAWTSSAPAWASTTVARRRRSPMSLAVDRLHDAGVAC
ncbi:MAG: hypothetical protein IPI35_21260 [Deltaproteobacteria bacterium]|nr:hypothetical protein [Deltaproteobacteria bacterium]